MENKIHAISWNELCKPKLEGGVEIRKLQDVNATAGLKLIWKLCKSQSLWALWMKEKYCKDLTIWNARVSSLDSGTMKFIYVLRNTAADNMTMDTSTRVWTRKANAQVILVSLQLGTWSDVILLFLNFILWCGFLHTILRCMLLLIALKNGLLTRDRFSNFGITQQVQCVMCHTGLESIHHLFFECPYAAYIWSHWNLKLTLNTTISNMEEEAKNPDICF